MLEITLSKHRSIKVVGMLVNIASFVVLLATCCVVSANAQFKQGAAAPAEPPAAVRTAVQKLQTDIQQMKAAGRINQAKIIQDIQDIADAAKTSYPNPSPAVQEQIKTIQTNINQIKSSGKADPQQISKIIQSIRALTGGK